LSRIEPKAAGGVTPLRVLERVAEELRRHGIDADVARDPLGRYDIYVGFDDIDKLDRLCSEKKLSPEAEKLLC